MLLFVIQRKRTDCLPWGEILSPAQTRARIEAITPAALQAMARRLFAEDSLSSLIYL